MAGEEGRKIGPYLALAAAAVALRIALAPFTEDPWDLPAWRLAGVRLCAGQSPYEPADALPFAYPPLWGAWCWAAAALAGEGPVALWRLVLKLPLIAAEVGLAAMLWKRAGAGAGLAVLLSPLFFAVSALWGQFDALPCLCLALGIAALEDGRPARAGLLLGIATGFKGFFPGFIVPWLAIHAARRLGLPAAARFLGASGLALGTILAPALLLDGRDFLACYAFHADRAPQGLTPWIYAASLARAIADPLLAAALVLATAWLATEASIARGCALLVAVFLVTSKVVNEQYLLWLATPLLMAGMLREAWAVMLAGTAFLALHIGPDLVAPITGQDPVWWTGARWPELYQWLGWMGVAIWMKNLGIAKRIVSFRPSSLARGV